MGHKTKQEDKDVAQGAAGKSGVISVCRNEETWEGAHRICMCETVKEQMESLDMKETHNRATDLPPD